MLIPVRNMARLLDEQLAALGDQTYEGAWELVVVDNGSDDDVAGVVDAHRPRLPRTTLVRHEPPGVGGALRAGAAEARSDAFVLLDADDVVATDYLAVMADALTRHEFVAGRLDTTRLNPAWLHEARAVPQAHGLYDRDGVLTWAQGCALAVRREALERAGGFPQRHTDGVDVDLCAELQRAGALLTFVPDAVVHYRLRSRSSEMLTQFYGYGRSSVRHFAEYRELGLRRPVPWRLPLRWLRLVMLTPVALFDRRRRVRWLGDVGLSLGMLRESLALRVWHP